MQYPIQMYYQFGTLSNRLCSKSAGGLKDVHSEHLVLQFVSSCYMKYV